MGCRGSCPAPLSELEARVSQGAPGRARTGCGSDFPCSPPPTWPSPCQPLRGSGAASCGSGRGYRRPRPGQLSSAAPSRHLAQGVMAPLWVERAPGGSRLGVTRAQRPAALRLPPLWLLLLLLGAASTSPESLNQSHPTEDSLVSKGFPSLSVLSLSVLRENSPLSHKCPARELFRGIPFSEGRGLYFGNTVDWKAEREGQGRGHREAYVPTGKMEDYETNVLPCWYYYKSCMDSVKDWCNWTLISRYYSNLQYCLEYEADKFGLGFPNPLAESIILEAHLIYFVNCSLVQPTLSDPPEDVLLAMIIAPICLIPFLVTLVVWRSKDNDAQA